MEQKEIPVPMFNPVRHYHKHKKEYDNAYFKIMESGYFINGPAVKEFEQELKTYTGTKHCLGVSSGTSALLIALMAMDIGPGDEVITVPFTWISTAGVICRVGATPVFCDINPKSYNMDPNSLKKVLTKKTKAVMPVSIFGQVYDVEGVAKVVREYEKKVGHKIYIIEDAAQSFGATTSTGKLSCSLSDVGTTSFFPTKPLGGHGDAGACFTNDDDLDHKMRAIRGHGCIVRYQYERVGINGRIDTLQAALLQVKLKHLEPSLQGRIAHAKVYDRELKGLPLTLPPTMPFNKRHVYAQYTIALKDSKTRDGLMKHLKSKKIGCGAFYPVCLHLVKCLTVNKPYSKGSIPVSEELAGRVLSLPVYAEMTDKEQQEVIRVIKNYLKQ